MNFLWKNPKYYISFWQCWIAWDYNCFNFFFTKLALNNILLQHWSLFISYKSTSWSVLFLIHKSIKVYVSKLIFIHLQLQLLPVVEVIFFVIAATNTRFSFFSFSLNIQNLQLVQVSENPFFSRSSGNLSSGNRRFLSSSSSRLRAARAWQRKN